MRKPSMVKVSVIIPTRNRLTHLLNCLKSLALQSNQSFEIIIVDNSDVPLKDRLLLKLFPTLNLSYFHTQIIGVAHARNLGINHARASVLAFLDDDCTAHKNWIEGIIKSFKTHKYPVIMGKNLNGYPNNVFSITEHFRTKERFEKDLYWLDTKNFAVSKHIILKHNLFFDRRFDNYSRGEDIDLSIRLRKLNIPIIFCQNCISFHYGATSLATLLLKEFTKGRGRFHLELKWKNLENTDHKRFSQIKDLFKDEIYKKRSLVGKLTLLFVLVLAHAAFKLGKIFESI